MPMLNISREKQWMMIGASYAVITVFAASTIYARHLQMLRDPVTAASGMAAAGDTLLGLFLFFLYIVPTAFVLRLMADHERVYDAYSCVLFALGLTAPLALGLLVANSKLKTDWFQGLALARLFCVLLILIAIGVSRWMARSARSKRMVNYAGLTEVLTLLVVVVIWVRA
jgi:hypothetical protein